MASARRRVRRAPPVAAGNGVAVATRKLIVAALVTGLVILVAFALWLYVGPVR